MTDIILSGLIILALIALVYIFSKYIPDIKNSFKFSQKTGQENPKPAWPKIKMFSKPAPIKGTMEEAQKYFEEKNYRKAEELYIGLAAKEPKNAKIYNRLGAIYLEENNFYDAKASFHEALKYDDKIASRWYNLGISCAGLLEYRNAIDALEKAVKLEKSNQKYQKTLAETKTKLKKFVEKK